ncbi:putative glycosyl transferase [Candidatus Nitrotoga sp. BS]|uniref:glycosyltransferase family 2 protein n=1 Tax=Candidatus Nitrotoga sp. BS TaxID=2890408 RepID=UPI001EF3C0F7|nr:glycosyltransferase family A protein [Candidatus Nitrotoga sp. BS]CAH1202360.1 putative glycosyl transferase [Candidatus Nitrotoga sp. BS]
MTPLISICIPTYNGARYLEACLNSVLNQTYKDIEILVVDDGSTDTTFEILERYAASDQRIRLVRNEHNLGLVGNWNHCIELAQGEWIKFVFQDDLISQTCLERLIAESKKGCSFIACKRGYLLDAETSENVQQFYFDNQILIDSIFPDSRWISAQEYCQLAVNRIGMNFIGEPTSVMLKKNVFEQYGLFNPNLIMSCDLEYWTRVAIHTGLIYVSENLATFRVHKGATSATNRSHRQYRMEVLDALIILHDIVYASNYAPLREAASSRQPPVDLLKKLSEQARGAKWLAVDAANREDNPDSTLIKEWDQVVIKYPHLAKLTSTTSSHQGNNLLDIWRDRLSRFF